MSLPHLDPEKKNHKEIYEESSMIKERYNQRFDSNVLRKTMGEKQIHGSTANTKTRIKKQQKQQQKEGERKSSNCKENGLNPLLHSTSSPPHSRRGATGSIRCMPERSGMMIIGS
mmetsp:Transcript_21036/g.23800  ORF Transcript_21036/g.23800 Transcript_21036/m.23800 type:complete len:115 (+) Transcript_21036:161-505(+)